MTPTNEEYIIAGFCEAVSNDLSNIITWEALTQSDRGDGSPAVIGKKFDDNIQAAIQAGDWLDRVVEQHT